MTKILAFGSFKQSGKSSTCQFLTEEIDKIKSYAYIPQEFGGSQAVVSGSRYRIKTYSFADKLKQFCVECLGLSEAQCYGTDDDKNSLTHLRWENMPGIISNTSLWFYLKERNLSQPISELLTFHETGPMTAREVLQYFGTGICRKMYSNIWVDSCLRQIKKDNLDFALIADCRFRNEAEAIQKAGGKVIGFMRRPFPNDTHQSEVDLIGYPFDVSIDNTDLTLDEKNKKVLGLLKEWNWL
jgi:hypothetical protein